MKTHITYSCFFAFSTGKNANARFRARHARKKENMFHAKNTKKSRAKRAKNQKIKKNQKKIHAEEHVFIFVLLPVLNIYTTAAATATAATAAAAAAATTVQQQKP